MKLVVLAGGSGSRLWPLSRSKYPKQFLSLHGEDSMLQTTVNRVVSLFSDSPMIISNESHRFIVAEQMREKNIDVEILLEPIGKNTAPAIGMAAMMSNIDEDPIMLVLPADHIIEDLEEFRAKISQAENLAKNGNLVLFGIVPDKPETGYGYIKRGKKIHGGYQVEKFVEKPNYETAQKYIDSSEYYWNSGMFVFRASRYLEELEKLCPDVFKICSEAVKDSSYDMDFIRINEDAFKICPDISIDIAIMEKTDSVVVPLDAGWNDAGNWGSLYDINPKDKELNVIKGDVISHKTHNSFILSSSRLVATIGISNLIIAETKDAVLVATKEEAQNVKKVVEQLKFNKRAESDDNKEVIRPWGKFDSVDKGKRYQVKHITVKPGGKLSVQKHHHRAEHWVVVVGTALVGRDGKEELLTENESVYIPVGSIHWLKNPGKIPLEIIEVQTGAYLDEDDIVRYSDNYGRK